MSNILKDMGVEAGTNHSLDRSSSIIDESEWQKVLGRPGVELCLLAI